MASEFSQEKVIAEIQTAFGKRLMNSNVPVLEYLANNVTIGRYFINHDLYERILSPDTLEAFDTMMTMSLADFLMEQFKPMFRKKGYHRLPESVQQIIYMLAVNCFYVRCRGVAREGSTETKDKYYFAIPDSIVEDFESKDITSDTVIMWFDNYTPENLIRMISMYVAAIQSYIMRVAIRMYPRFTYMPANVTREELVYQMAAVYMNHEHVYKNPKGGDDVPISTLLDPIINAVDTIEVEDSDLDDMFVSAIEPALRAVIFGVISQNGFGMDFNEIIKHANDIKVHLQTMCDDDDFDHYEVHVMFTTPDDSTVIAEYNIRYSDIVELVKKDATAYVSSVPLKKREIAIGADLMKCAHDIMIYIIGRSVEGYVAETEAQMQAESRTTKKRASSVKKTTKKKK